MEYPFYASRLYRVSCRKKAQRLLDYPWKTHVLWEIDNLHLEIEPENEADERFLHYLACFSEFESRIFFNHAALRCSPEVAMLRESISYAPYRFDSVPLPWPNTKDHKRYAELCSVLTSYRLAEVFIQHLSPNLVREQPSSELSRRAIEGHHSILNKAWLHMADIETLVNGFVYALPHGKSSLLSSGSESSSSEDLLPYLLQRLARHKGNNKSNRIALNFAVTAIHLLYITSQKFSGARPDIPNSFRELLDTIPRSSSTPVEFTNADIDYLQDLMADMNNFKTPLQLAANLTPLALFIPVDLTKTPCSRVFIIEVFASLISSKQLLIYKYASRQLKLSVAELFLR
ncbi:hypothetical protein BJ165DRAFT_216033 [Panaeolus papilionaceus]|nr:hypothetical protein BJ165DRAFT_216033 [Panaeolus papilionaceus]